MNRPEPGTAGLVALLLATLAFAVSQPILLIGIPAAVLMAAFGPRDARAFTVILAVAALAMLGDRSGLWWFERGWPLLLGGMFVWTSALGRNAGFTARGLAALALAALFGALVFGVSPGAWRELDGAMAARTAQAARLTADLLGGGVGETVSGVAASVGRLQAALFPALLGLSSLAALGVAAYIHGALTGPRERDVVGSLREFRFNDHLVWLWVAGLFLLLAPIGGPGARVGGNAVLFMGVLYALRGLAVALSLAGTLSFGTLVLAGLVLIVLSPLLLLALAGALLVGLSDTWFDLRAWRRHGRVA